MARCTGLTRPPSRRSPAGTRAGPGTTNLALPLQSPWPSRATAFDACPPWPPRASRRTHLRLAFEGEATTQNARCKSPPKRWRCNWRRPWRSTWSPRWPASSPAPWACSGKPHPQTKRHGPDSDRHPLALEQLALRQNGKSLVSLSNWKSRFYRCRWTSAPSHWNPWR